MLNIDGQPRQPFMPVAADIIDSHASKNRPARRSLNFDFRARLGMPLLIAFFRNIVHLGTLTIVAPDGRVDHVGTGLPFVTIRLTDSSIIPGIVLNPDLTIGEAYMNGDLIIEEGDVYDFLNLCFVNLGRSNGHGLMRFRSFMMRLGRRIAQHNPISIARKNIAHHYDLSDTLYDLFLDSGRQYSCGYYGAPTDSLEQAQEQKKRHLAAKLLLQPGQKILDIGCGWGGLAFDFARVANVDVTGVTLSVQQHKYAEQLACQNGLEDRVRFLLSDYRLLQGKFDRIVSVGMFEHVGVGHYREYFAKIRDLLEDDGIALVHTIGRADGPGAANAWINKYIVPGGYVAALSEIMPAIEQAGLYVTDVEILRLHYAETLKEWRKRFNLNRARIVELYDERFCRMWEFYLAGSEAAFRHSGLVNFQLQLSKRIDSVPLTRDYIRDWENVDSQKTRRNG